MSEPTDTPPQTVNMVSPQGETYAIPLDQVDAARVAQFRLETPEDQVARVAKKVNDERYGGVGGAVRAGVAGAANALTLGGFSALATDDFKRDIRGLREAHPIATVVGDVGGTALAALATGGSSLAATPAGLAMRGGRAVSSLGEGAGAFGRIATSAAGGALEGAAFGLGSGVTDLALSEDPVSWERATSVLSSHALFGAGIGGLAGTIGKSAEVGLAKARGALAEGVAARAAVDSLPADLAGLDVKGLRAAEKLELEAIKAARATERSAIVDDLAVFRRETEASKPWLSVQGLTDDVIGAEAGKVPVQEIAAMTQKADKRIRSLLNNPKDIAGNVAPVRSALQQQEHALEQLLTREQAIRTAIAADTTGARAAALDAVVPALERNRALQARIADATADLTSPRLQQITAARDALSTPAPPKSWAEGMISGITFGKATAAVGAVGAIVGGPFETMAAIAAPVIGAKAAKIVGEKVFGRVAKASSERAAASARGVEMFFDTSTAAVKAAPVLATKVLTAARYAPAAAKAKGSEPAGKPARGGELAHEYKRVADEIRSQTAIGLTGKPEVRQEARARIAETLSPIAAFAPLLADRMETVAVRRLEFLAGKLPTRPDLPGMAFGPDRWQPSDMEMRRFARYVATTEDPDAVMERVAAGSVTPEDREAMVAVYPEMLANLTRQVVEKLPTLRKQLPYQRRLALSIFTGVPVDPAMHPRILASLQASFAGEPGTSGGTQAPIPQPQFGSVKAEPATPAQERAS